MTTYKKVRVTLDIWMTEEEPKPLIDYFIVHAFRTHASECDEKHCIIRGGSGMVSYRVGNVEILHENFMAPIWSGEDCTRSHEIWMD